MLKIKIPYTKFEYTTTNLFLVLVITQGVSSWQQNIILCKFFYESGQICINIYLNAHPSTNLSWPVLVRRFVLRVTI